jgi:hypothetical protein
MIEIWKIDDPWLSELAKIRRKYKNIYIHEPIISKTMDILCSLPDIWKTDDPWFEIKTLEDFILKLAALQQDLPPEFLLSDEDLSKCI